MAKGKISFMDGFKFGLGFTAAGAIVGAGVAMIGSAMGISALSRAKSPAAPALPSGTAGFDAYEFAAGEARRIGQTELPEREFRERLGQDLPEREFKERLAAYEFETGEARRIGAAPTPQDEFPSMSLRGEGDEFPA
jgi:hypothetical protein